jgi:SH3-like domain-containing protein
MRALLPERLRRIARTTGRCRALVVAPLAALLLLLLAMAAGPTAEAQVGRSTGLPLPRFVSLAADRVNVRNGPGEQYPIQWVFVRRGVPVEIVAEHDNWRRITDHEGDRGWVYGNLLSSRRTVLVTGEIRPLRRTPRDDARPILRAEPGVLGELFGCQGEWCRVEIAGRRGWLKRDEVWGVLPEEVFN